MIRIRWTPLAAADWQNIIDYPKGHHPQFRQPTLRKLYQKIRALRDAPYVGWPGRIEGTRELLFLPCPILRRTGNGKHHRSAFITPHKTSLVSISLLSSHLAPALVLLKEGDRC